MAEEASISLPGDFRGGAWVSRNAGSERETRIAGEREAGVAERRFSNRRGRLEKRPAHRAKIGLQ